MSLPTTTLPEEQDTEQTSLMKINALMAGGFSSTSSSALSTQSRQYSNVSTDSPTTADGDVFTLAAGEKGVIQNLDDAAVYVKYGTGASSTSFSYVLKAGTAANDGIGGTIIIDDFIGVVSIAAAAGSPRVIAFKLS